MGKIILNGKEYTGGGSSEATEYYQAAGQIVDSVNNSLTGVGSASVVLSGGVASIDFDIQFTHTGSGSDVFDYGLSVDLLQALIPELPEITPLHGGWWRGNGDTGYASVCEGANEYHTRRWAFGRYYEATLSAIGAWSCSYWQNGWHIYGRCYGTY